MVTVKPDVRAELVRKNFGGRLASVRRAKRISQSELGKMVGLSRGSISNLESGVQNVQLYQVFTFAHVLNAPVNELVPLLQEVIIQDGSAEQDQIFLQVSRRQLIDSGPFGDEDEDA